MSKLTRKSIQISVILLALIILISLLVSVTLDFGGRRRESLVKVYNDFYILKLHNFPNAQEWIKEDPYGVEYANQTVFGMFFYEESGDLRAVENWRPPVSIYAENPRLVLYKISPFIKVYDVFIMPDYIYDSYMHSEFNGVIIYYSTNKGEYIYYSEYDGYHNYDQYLFPIDEAYKLSEFFYENYIDYYIHADGGGNRPRVEEYERAAEFEIKPLTPAIYYISQCLGLVLLWGMLFIIVKFILKRREKALDKSPASTIEE